MRFFIACITCLFCLGQTLGQGTISLASTAAADSAMVDYFSDAFGRINLLTVSPGFRYAFWQLSNSSTPSSPRTTTPISTFGNAYNMFPNSVNFQIGSLNYDNSGLTGSGVESRSITGITANFHQDMDPRLNYTTTFPGFSGTVTFTDSVLSSINLTTNIRFTFTEAPLLNSPYNGTFNITGDQFSLVVDDTPLSGLPVHILWDASGTVLAVSAVPEPGTLVLGGAVSAGALIIVWRRRRAASQVDRFVRSRS